MFRLFSRTGIIGIGLAFAALIMLVACSDDGGNGDGGQGNDTPITMAPADQQVLRLRLGGEPKTIDPHLSSTVSETSLTKPVFAGLFTYNEDLTVVPNVAAEMPTVDNGGISRDGLTYTVKLDRDAKWSDGKA